MTPDQLNDLAKRTAADTCDHYPAFTKMSILTALQEAERDARKEADELAEALEPLIANHAWFPPGCGCNLCKAKAVFLRTKGEGMKVIKEQEIKDKKQK